MRELIKTTVQIKFSIRLLSNVMYTNLILTIIFFFKLLINTHFITPNRSTYFVRGCEINKSRGSARNNLNGNN